MIGMKKRVSIFAAVALAIAMASPMMGTPAYAAKPCIAGKSKTKGCKNEIKGCIGLFNNCKDVKGKARKTCKKNCSKAVLAACRANQPTTDVVCSASPSGAFLDH
jgi:hypothetical protein